MSKQIATPSLSQGNHVYLYRLLRDAIGCGKQTFMTQVEEALVAGDMAAADLGFESTRELLEELDDCVKLTVFKGGRIYATVIANEQWNAALAKADELKQKDAGKKQKSWKKKKGDKAIKAVRPKHVKRPEPEPELEPVPEPSTQPEAKNEAEQPVDAVAETVIEVAAESPEDVAAETIKLINSDIFNAEDEPVEEPTVDVDEDVADTEPVVAPETPQPKISLTVVYDPEHANAGVTTLESTPAENTVAEAKVDTVDEDTEANAGADTPAEKSSVKVESAPKPQPAKTDEPDVKPEPRPAHTAVREPKETPEAKPQPKPAPKPQPKPRPTPEPVPVHEPAESPKPTPTPATTPIPELPKIPEDYPVDFALEVFCPGPLLHELSTYLPYGADALGIAGEYYWIARERGTIQASRNRATFPLRYTQDGKRHEVEIRIRRNTSGPGATWAIDKIETPAK